MTAHESSPRRVVVDAANVVGSRPDGWWRDRPGAARRLVTRLEPLTAEHEVVVVLEGAARDGAAAGTHARVEVVHAGGSGDDEIVRQVGPGTRVVTSDRELRRRVEAAGGSCVGPRWLDEQLGSDR